MTFPEIKTIKQLGLRTINFNTNKEEYLECPYTNNITLFKNKLKEIDESGWWITEYNVNHKKYTIPYLFSIKIHKDDELTYRHRGYITGNKAKLELNNLFIDKRIYDIKDTEYYDYYFFRELIRLTFFVLNKTISFTNIKPTLYDKDKYTDLLIKEYLEEDENQDISELKIEIEDSFNYEMTPLQELCYNFDIDSFDNIYDFEIYFPNSNAFIFFMETYKRFWNLKMFHQRSFAHKNWSDEVKYRDNYTCQNCGAKDNLKAHHIKHYALNKETRYDIDNGITLCGKCHYEKHKREGF